METARKIGKVEKMKKIMSFVFILLISIGRVIVVLSLSCERAAATPGELNPEWYKTWGGSWNDKGYGITEYNGCLYVIGNEFVDWDNPDIFLLKYGTDGNLIWNRTWSGNGSDYGYGITEYNGYLYLTGGSNSYGTGDTDVLLLKYYTRFQVPSAPQNLQATSGDGYVNLTWNPPADNGGSAITNYKIYRGTTTGSETYLATVGNIYWYNNTNVTNGQMYYYRVNAVNSVGEGPQANEVHVTPNALFPPEEPFFSQYWWAFIIIAIVIVTLIAGIKLYRKSSK